MKFNSSNGIFFELKIEGYQFPEILDSYWASNWLYINIAVNHPKGNWTATDPSLTTFEVERLAKWLEDIHHETDQLSSYGFTEPYIEFEIIKNKNKQSELRVYLERIYLPDWGVSRGAGFRDFWIEFSLNELDLIQAAKDLRLELQNFPQRVFR
jgi:hypothetical protein